MTKPKSPKYLLRRVTDDIAFLDDILPYANEMSNEIFLATPEDVANGVVEFDQVARELSKALRKWAAALEQEVDA